MSLPTMTGVGRLIDAPELRFTSTGKAVTKVRLAFNSRKKNQQTQEWEDGDVFFVDGTVWDQEAENVAECLDKGHEVLVTGQLKTRRYETREGEKRSSVELAIYSIGPTLKNATAKVQKVQRGSSGNAPTGGGFEDPWATNTPASADTARSSFGDQDPPF